MRSSTDSTSLAGGVSGAAAPKDGVSGIADGGPGGLKGRGFGAGGYGTDELADDIPESP